MAKKEKKKKEQINQHPQQNTPQTHPLTTGQPNMNIPKDTGEMTPEELHQMQLEQAIKESSDPTARLRKLKNPFNFKGCLLSLIFGFILVIGVVYLVTYFRVDKFDFMFITRDILEKSGITDLYNDLIDKIKELFGANEEETTEAVVGLFNMTIGRWFR